MTDVRLPVRLASYNIHRCAGSDGRSDPGRIAAVLSELDADIIALQEVETGPGAGLDLLQHLSGELGMRALAGPTLLRGDARYGNALLARPALRAVARLNLAVDGYEPRGALLAEFGPPGGPVRLCVTHLGLRCRERLIQCRRICQRLQQDPPCSAHVLFGDLNLWLPGEPAAQVLRRHFGPAAAGPRSYPARWPLLRLDRVLARAPARVAACWAHRSTLARRASDHLPVVATLEWDAA